MSSRMDKRKRFGFISPFHRWFFFKFAIYASGFVMLVGVGMYAWFQYFMREVVRVAPYLDTRTLVTLQESFRGALGLGLIFIFLLLGIGLLSIALLGQRIAGPLYAISRDLDSVKSDGAPRQIRLREDDLFGELASKINRALGVEVSESPRE